MSGETDIQVAYNELRKVLKNLEKEDVPGLIRRLDLGLIEIPEGVKERFEWYRMIVKKYLPQAKNLQSDLNNIDEVLSYFSD